MLLVGSESKLELTSINLPNDMLQLIIIEKYLNK